MEYGLSSRVVEYFFISIKKYLYHDEDKQSYFCEWDIEVCGEICDNNQSYYDKPDEQSELFR